MERNYVKPEITVMPLESEHLLAATEPTMRTGNCIHEYFIENTESLSKSHGGSMSWDDEEE